MASFSTTTHKSAASVNLQTRERVRDIFLQALRRGPSDETPTAELKGTAVIDRRYRRSISQERNDRRRLELFSALQEVQFDQENRCDEVAADFLDESDRRSGRPASREQIVDQNHFLAVFYRIDVQFHLSFAVLQSISGRFRFIGKPSFFPQRHKPDPELVGNGRSEQEAARINADHLVDLFAATFAQEKVAAVAEQRAILQDGGNILEANPRFRKSGTSRMVVR